MKKNFDIKNLKTAKKYAHALFESTQELNNEIVNDLTFVSDSIFQNNEFKSFFSHPVICACDKKNVLKESFDGKINPKTMNFLEVLLDEGRFSLFETIFELYIKECDKIQNKQKVEIISAVALDDDVKWRLCEKLAQKLSARIVPEFCEDKNILGGMVIKFEDKVIDLSLKAKFASLKTN